MSAIDISIDALTGDIEIQNFDLVILRDTDTVVQRLRIKLQRWLSEWFLDIRDGVPYVEEILKKGVNPGVVDQIFRDEILSTEDVIRIVQFEMDFNKPNRELSIVFQVETTFGVSGVEEVSI